MWFHISHVKCIAAPDFTCDFTCDFHMRFTFTNRFPRFRGPLPQDSAPTVCTGGPSALHAEGSESQPYTGCTAHSSFQLSVRCERVGGTCAEPDRAAHRSPERGGPRTAERERVRGEK